MQIKITNKRVLAFFGFYGIEDEPIEPWVSMSHRMWWRVFVTRLRRICQ
jgi:hypothetical protein